MVTISGRSDTDRSREWEGKRRGKSRKTVTREGQQHCAEDRNKLGKTEQCWVVTHY